MNAAPAGMTVHALLILATVIAALSSLAMLVMRGLYNKLHYLAPPAILGTAAVAAAIVLQEGFTAPGIKSLLVLLIMLIANPVVTHVAARAMRTRSRREGK